VVLRWDNSFVWLMNWTYLGGQISNRYSMWEQNGNWIVDCVSQELLEMFGLPYIIAPMEAEAQCAYLDTVHLVDGVVTDDCDVFLFGGLSVYKNIFDDRKYVETYYMKDVQSEMGLNREKLIRMALLLGSDYTEGIRYIFFCICINIVVLDYRTICKHHSVHFNPHS
jgi:hypothetical protein